MVRWSLVVSKEADIAVRTYLAQQGLRKGDLSKFVEEAVRWRVWSRTGGEGEIEDDQRAVEEAFLTLQAACNSVRQGPQKRIQAIQRRMEHAIAHHDFEAARACEEEERRERERHPRQAEFATLTRAEVEELVARCAGVPVSRPHAER